MKNRSDRELFEFLTKTSSDTIFSLVEMMETFWQREIDKVKKNVDSESAVPTASSTEREALAHTIANMLRYFGSHGAAYVWRGVFSSEPGASYQEILVDVVKAVSKSVRGAPPIPRVATVEEYERLLCESLLRLQFQGKSEAEIAEMLKESGLDKEAAVKAAKQLALFAVGGGGLLILVKALGKKTVKSIVERVIVWVVAKRLGKEAAERIALRLLKGVAQKSLQRLLGWVGVALLAWDVVSLAGPASRITIPCVSLIAATRTLERNVGEK